MTTVVGDHRSSTGAPCGVLGHVEDDYIQFLTRGGERVMYSQENNIGFARNFFFNIENPSYDLDAGEIDFYMFAMRLKLTKGGSEVLPTCNPAQTCIVNSTFFVCISI